MASSLHVPTAIAAAMLAAALANVAQHPVIELEMSDWYEAVRVKPGSDLRSLTEGHFDSTRGRYEVHVEIADVAPGAVVEVAADSQLLTEELRGLGRASEVVRLAEEPVLDTAVAVALEPFVVAEGYHRRIGDYSIAVSADGPVERLVVAAGPDHMWVVDVALLARVQAEAS